MLVGPVIHDVVMPLLYRFRYKRIAGIGVYWQDWCFLKQNSFSTLKQGITFRLLAGLLSLLHQSFIFRICPASPVVAIIRSKDVEKILRIVKITGPRASDNVVVPGTLRGKKHFPFLVFQFYRSEEHTSELQSRENLVCRLLLEK